MQGISILRTMATGSEQDALGEKHILLSRTFVEAGFRLAANVLLNMSAAELRTVLSRQTHFILKSSLAPFAREWYQNHVDDVLSDVALRASTKVVHIQGGHRK